MPREAGTQSRALVLAALAAALGAYSVGNVGCLEPRESRTRTANECATCHGSPTRGDDPLIQSAPPTDVAGHTEVGYPGVGAHERHLLASPRNGAVPCDTCHVVPKQTGDPGHADDDLPAELKLAGLATAKEHTPKYDYARRRCTNTYCHGAEEPQWIAPRTPEETCGTCHALPPPAPHPQSKSCDRCHGEVVAADGAFVAPEKHVDGKVQVKFTCKSCHGSDDNPAPPTDLAGNAATTSPGVGAHQIHLSGGESSRPLECDDCHKVPKKVTDDGHLDEAPADVVVTGIAQTDGRSPTWSHAELRCASTWCHGPGDAANESPVWTDATPLGCDGCHGAPPPPPHPPISDCSRCHVDAGPGPSIVARALHIDGKIEVVVPTACDACHGSGPLGAPPPNLDGETDPSAHGVGAHATHLAGTIRSRAVQCNECHVVPTDVFDPGHFDSALPAELTFSGVALSWGATPSYDGNSCANTYCHGGMFVAGHASGGSVTSPAWLPPPPMPLCGSCHGLPPPDPHPVTAQPCSDCHSNLVPDLGPDGYVFPDPSTHVNGIVDLSPN